MKISDEELRIKHLKDLYKPGTRIRLVKMSDTQAPPCGTEGEVAFVDDIGTIHMKWDNGSTLGLIEELDIFEIIY